MPKDMSLLKCLNCGNYVAGQKLLHRDDCIGPVVVEVITQKVAVYCLHCGRVVTTEPRTCSCGHKPFGAVYKEPTLSHMEAVIHLLIDALAKAQGHSPESPEPGGADDDERI